MDFGFTREQESLRKEVRQFIEEDVTPELVEEMWPGHGDVDDPNVVRGRGPLARELFREIGERGWLAISWPKEYGGQGGDRMTQFIVEEQFARAGLRIGGAPDGTPAILAVGTEEQKREFIPRLISGEYSFALGYTEPRGGADLANLQCSAVLDGDFYVINGQKTFTSAAHTATHIYLMARTDPDASPPHRGISIFIFPMDATGITVRPLWTIQNDPAAPEGTLSRFSRTNETFFEDVRVPRTALLGEENMGWYVGSMALNLDRVGAGRMVGAVSTDEHIINWVKGSTLGGYALVDDPAIRDKLAEMWIEAQVCWLVTMRSMSIVQRDEAFTYEGSAEKIWANEHSTRNTEAIAQMLGPYAQLLSGSPEAVERGTFAHNVLSSWVAGNNHGSTHVLRDQVARRGLGLPRG